MNQNKNRARHGDTDGAPSPSHRTKLRAVLVLVAGLAGSGVGAITAPALAGATAIPSLRITAPVSYPVNPLCASLGQRGTTEGFTLTNYPARSAIVVDIASVARRVNVKTVVTGVTGSVVGSFAQPSIPAGAYSLQTRTSAGAVLAATPISVGASDCWSESMPDGQSLIADFAGAGFQPGSVTTLGFSLSGGTGETLGVDGNGSFARANTNLGLCTEGSPYVAHVNGRLGNGGVVATNQTAICFGTHIGTMLFP